MSPSLIQINLSSANETRRRKRPQQSKASNVISIIASIFIFLVAVFYFYVTVKAKKVNRLKSEYSRIEKPFIEVNKLSELNNKLNLKITTLNKCKSERINLADKWIGLAKLTPEDIYITDIDILAVDKYADQQKVVIKARTANSMDESAVLHFFSLIENNTVLTNSFKDIVLSAVYSDGDEKVFSIELLENKRNNKK